MTGPVLSFQIPECITCVLGRLVFHSFFGKVHFLSPAMYWACSKFSDTGMYHMCIGVPCFLLSFGKVHFLSPGMYWACSKCSDTGIHQLCIGVPCFLLSFGKVPNLSPAIYWSCSKCSDKPAVNDEENGSRLHQ